MTTQLPAPPNSRIAVRAEGAVLRVRLVCADRRNTLTPSDFRHLADVIEQAPDDEALRVIEITADGDHFCAGADLAATNDPHAERPRTGHMVRGLARNAHRAIRCMHESPLPIVAGVRGTAAGFGCNLALAADFAMLAETARLVEVFVDRGLSPDSGASWLIPRLVGVARARRMLLLGEPVDGRRAAAWGLVHDAYPEDRLDAEVSALVDHLANAATLSVSLSKSLLHRGLETGLASALENEAYAEELAIRSLDFKEGLKAFRERRKPAFRGT